jgi:Phage integrase family
MVMRSTLGSESASPPSDERLSERFPAIGKISSVNVVRPSTTKNHKQAIIALHSDVVEELRKLRLSPGKVFSKGLPKMETFKRDLRRAGIDFIDAKGRRADFHSLRHTLGTNLALAGTAPRVAMEAMRHSDIRLTTKTYTDTGLLPVSDAVAKLPSFSRSQAKDSQRDSQSCPELVMTCQSLSSTLAIQSIRKMLRTSVI